MEMRFIRENIQLEQPLGTGRTTAAVEGDVMLPGGLREEARILSAQAMAVTESAEAMTDRVSISGRAVFHVLYTQGDPEKVNAIEAAADFRQVCEVPGAQPRASVDAQAQVKRVEARIANGRLSMRAEMDVAAQATAQSPVEAIMAIDGSDDVETRTMQQTLRRRTAQGSSDVLLREEMPLPEGLNIRETLYATACPVMSEATGGVGRIGLSGQVLLEAVHASSTPGTPVVITRHSLPFQQSVELSGEAGEVLDGSVTVKDVAVVSQDDGDGAQTLRAEVLLGLTAWTEREETVTVLSDAYTTQGDDLRLAEKEILCRTRTNRVHAAESGKAMLLLPDSAPPVRSVLAAFVTPVDARHEQSGGRMTVTGMLDTTLLYMTDDSRAPVSVRQQEPFRVTFAAQADENAMLTLAVTEAEAVPVTSDRVELRYILRMGLKGTESQPLRIVTEAQSVAAPQPGGDIVLYFTQPGDTLWDIARRYRLPVGEVKKLNPEMNGEPQTGQGVVVWRRSAAIGI